MYPLRKCISMGGAAWITEDFYINDYRFWGNREYIRDGYPPGPDGTRQTHWIKLWLDWWQLQPNSLATRAQSWNQLSDQRSVFDKLDAQIKAANDDGVQVILGNYFRYPLWANGGGGGAPPGKAGTRKVPNNVGGNSPWDWFIGYFMARYKYHAPVNPNGPRDGYTLGNPLGAYITAIEVCNEPNDQNYAYDEVFGAAGDLATIVGNMLVTAENASYYWGSLAPADYSIWVFGPSTSDIENWPKDDYGNVNYYTFSQRVLHYLKGWWHPRVYTAWTHHNYNDIKIGNDRPVTKTSKVRELLGSENWRGGGDRYIWLTEGGALLPPTKDDPRNYSSPSDFTDAQRKQLQMTQAAKVADSFYRMQAEPDIYMFSQHAINDAFGNTFKSMLRDDFANGQPGLPRELWYRWPGFLGSPGM
jgi:hypothetical protein